MGVQLGQFLGVVLGEILKIAGPVIEEMLYRAISRALSDRAVIAKPKEELQNEIKASNDPAHILDAAQFDGVRKASGFRSAWDRGENR